MLLFLFWGMVGSTGKIGKQAGVALYLSCPALHPLPSPQVSFQSQIQKPSPPLTMWSMLFKWILLPYLLSHGSTQLCFTSAMGRVLQFLTWVTKFLSSYPPRVFPPPETFFPALLLLINFYDTHPFVSLAVSSPYSLLVTATLLTSFPCVHTHRHSTASIYLRLQFQEALRTGLRLICTVAKINGC